jgi:hypothetical protein
LIVYKVPYVKSIPRENKNNAFFRGVVVFESSIFFSKSTSNGTDDPLYWTWPNKIHNTDNDCPENHAPENPIEETKKVGDCFIYFMKHSRPLVCKKDIVGQKQ